MSAKPKYTKTQIRTLNADQCTDELRSHNLDLIGGLGQKRDRLREAFYPNSTNISQTISQPTSTQPTQPDIPNLDDKWHILKRTKGPVYARIPEASCEKSYRIFTQLLINVVSSNNNEGWYQFLNFARCGLGSSSRVGTKHTSQAIQINKRLKAFTSGQPIEDQPSVKKPRSRDSPGHQSDIKSQVSAKLAMGYVMGVVNPVTSKETVLTPSKDTKVKLQTKHPPRNSHNHTISAPSPDIHSNLDQCRVSKEDVRWAIAQFKKGASGGPDGLRPQHQLDMTGKSSGYVPDNIKQTFYGANLMALKKPDGGIRPIAVGMTMQRLPAKIVMAKLRSVCENEFRPHQMGVSTPKGCAL